MSDQPELFSAEALKGGGSAALRSLHSVMRSCVKCPLHEKRTNVVCGAGRAEDVELVFVGEAPGANEDKEGLPFVGKAGQLLDKMIEAMGMKREDVFIVNAVSCRPTDDKGGNRAPAENEIAACRPFFLNQLRIVRPKLIVCLGTVASQSLLKSTKRIGDLRERWHEWEGVPVRATYHPSYLLREPKKKREAWEDLKLVLGKLEVIRNTENSSK